MVRQALIPILLALASCQSTEDRASSAAVVHGEAKAAPQFPDLPETCVVKTGRVRPSGEESRVMTLKRWEVVADVRDRQAEDCARWGAEMKSRWAGE